MDNNNRNSVNPMKRIAQKYSGNHPFIYTLNDGIERINRKLMKRYPLSNNRANLSCQPFFIVGSGRSGNTLLRSILFSHKDIVIPPESFALNRAIRKYRQLNWLDWKELCGVIISVFENDKKMERWDIDLLSVLRKVYELSGEDRTLSKLLDEIYCYYGEVHSPGFKRWGDKTPVNTFSLDLIREVYPKSQFVHIVRDARDVAQSYKKAGFYNSISEAAERWKSSVNTVYQFSQKLTNEQFMEIKYENLVRNPQAVIEQVSNFLGIEFNQEMLHHSENVNALGDSYLAHHENLQKPINPDSIGKGKKQLSSDDLNTIEKLCKKELERFAYY